MRRAQLVALDAQSEPQYQVLTSAALVEKSNYHLRKVNNLVSVCLWFVFGAASRAWNPLVCKTCLECVVAGTRGLVRQRSVEGKV